MTTQSKISPAFQPFLAHSHPDARKDAIVIYRGLLSPGSMPQPGTAAYYWQSRKPRNFSSWMKASSAFKRLSFNGYCDGGH